MSQALAPVDTGTTMDSFIERAALDPSFDVQKLEALLRMQRQMKQDAARQQFNLAMADAQAEMLPVARDATNTHTQSRYARLETIDAAMRPIYTKHGFAVRYGSGQPIQEGWVRVTCTVSHRAGYWEDHYLDAPPDSAGLRGQTNKTGVQSVGSSVSYLRRYLLAMVFNIVLYDDDDDGVGTGRTERPPGQPRTPADSFLRPLLVKDQTQWLRNVRALLAGAQTIGEANAIRDHYSVRDALAKAPTMIRRNIEDWIKEAHTRLAPAPPDETTTSSDEAPEWDDPIEELLDEVGRMDLVTLDSLPASAVWRSKTKDLFPPDADRLNEAIEERRRTMKVGGNGQNC